METIDGRYRVLRRLGRGATAEVLLVADQWRLDAPLALKRLRGEADLRALRTEFEALAGLRHPNLVALVDIALAVQPPYVTYEYVDGPDAATWARGRPALAVVQLLAALLRGLALLHDRGWVHGDVKPANVLVTAQDAPKLIDLGMAVHSARATTGGTAGYVAPELLSGQPATPAADVYSFACCALELLGGQKLYADDASVALRRQLEARPADTICEIVDQAVASLAPGLPPLLQRCLALDPKLRPTNALELLAGLEQHVPGLQAPRATSLAALPQPRLVGREAAMQRASEALQRAKTGQATAALAVVGPLGSGKTRALAEIRLRAMGLGYQCVAGRTLREALTEVGASLRVGADPAALASLDRFSAVLTGVTSEKDLRDHAPPADEQLGTRLRAALFSLLGHATSRGPMLLLFDDCEQLESDERLALADVLDGLRLPASRTAALPLVCVVACESSVAVPSGFETVALDPLSVEQSADLVLSMLPGSGIAEEVLGGIGRAGAGNPLLVQETLLIWLRSDAPPDWDDLRLDYPQRVLSAARAELAQLTAEQRRALGLLALAPRLSHRVLHALVPGLTPQALLELTRTNLVCERARPHALELALNGEALRQVLLEGLSEAQRRELHRKAATELQHVGAHPALAAYHLEHAGQPTEAADLYLSAATTELDVGGRWATRAAELGGPQWPGWPSAKRRAAGTLALTGELQRAADEIEALIEADAADDQDRLLLARYWVALDQPDRAQQVLDQLRSDSDHESAALIRLRALLTQGQHDAAQTLARQLPESAATLNALGLIYHARGDVPRAATTLQHALDLCQEHDQDGAGDELSKVANNLALVQQSRGQLSEARRLYALAADHAEETGHHLRAVQCRLNGSTVSQLAGDLEQARQGYERAVFDAVRLGSHQLEGKARLNHAILLMELGHYDAAENELTACQGRQGILAVYVTLNLVDIAVARQDFVAVDEKLLEADALAVQSDDAVAQIELLLVKARVEAARGRFDRGADLGDEAAQRAQSLGLAKLEDEARLQAVLANRRSAASNQDLGHQRGTLEQICQRMEQRGEWGRIWQPLYQLSLAETVLGLDVEASFHLNKAGQALDRMLSDLPSELQTRALRRPDLQQAYAATRDRRQAGERVGLSPAAQAIPASSPFSLHTLLQTNLDLARVRDPQALVTLVLDKAIELAGAQRGLIILCEGDDLRVAAARNIDQQSLQRGSEAFSKSVATQVLATGHAVLTVDALNDERFTRFDSVHVLKLRSVVCVPLRIWGSMAGVIYLDNRFRPDAFDRAHVELLEGFGVQAGLALDAARVFDKLRQQLDQLQQAKQEIETLTEQLREALQKQAVDLEQAQRTMELQRQQLTRSAAFSDVVGTSAAIRRVLELIDKTGHTEIAVYLYGESGTGKEVIANAIHRASRRHNGPLVSLNCAALSPELLASELFGHIKGAFTGAHRDHEGLIAAAEGGTLFLDEITDMSAGLQAQLLRVLQTGDYRPVGSSRVLHADVRVISASNLDLDEAVSAGRFRQDLFYRLNVLRLDLPPLRHRMEDVPLLVRHFVGERQISQGAMNLLLTYDWPGNVRELANELARAQALARPGEEVRSAHLSTKLTHGLLTQDSPGGALAAQMDTVERQLLLRALMETEWNASEAAERLGLSRAGLYYKLNQHDIDITRLRKKARSQQRQSNVPAGQ